MKRFKPSLRSRLNRNAKDTAETFAELYDYYLPKVFHYISYQVGDMDLAEDLTSAAFEKALAKLDSYRSNKASFSTWLMTVARNTVIDYYRVKSRKITISIEETFEPASEEISPEEEVIRKEEMQRLKTYLRELSQPEREIISLKFGAELNNRQIAKMLGLSESNVGTKLYRAICKLRDKFKDSLLSKLSEVEQERVGLNRFWERLKHLIPQRPMWRATAASLMVLIVTGAIIWGTGVFTQPMAPPSKTLLPPLQQPVMLEVTSVKTTYSLGGETEFISSKTTVVTPLPPQMATTPLETEHWEETVWYSSMSCRKPNLGPEESVEYNLIWTTGGD